MFCHHNPTNIEAAANSAQVYDVINTGVMRPTLLEMESLLQGSKKEGARLPPSHLHGVNMLEKHVLLNENSEHGFDYLDKSTG